MCLLLLASRPGPLAVLLLILFSGAPEFSSAQSGEAQSHAERGLQLAQSGDLQGAERELTEAVKLQPRNPEFLSTYGTVLAMEKKFDESTAAFRRALQITPQDFTARRYLAANLWQLHRYAEAKQELQIMLRQQPNDASARLLMGMVAENSEDYATAVKMLSSVPNEVARQPESVAALARSYYQLHEREKSRLTLSLLPKNMQAAILGAGIADQAGDHEEAEQLLQAVRDSDPAAIDYRKALVQYHAANFAECQSTLLALGEHYEMTSAGYNLLGWCYHRQNKPKEATQAFEQAIRLAPDDQSNYLDLIKVLEAHKLLKLALDAAKQAATKFPNSAKVLNLEGGIETQLSQFTDAINSYQKALQLDGSDPDSILGLARAQASAGQISEAEASFRGAMQRFPKDAAFKVAYAELLLKQAEAGDTDANRRAEQLLNSAVLIDPSNGDALYQLGTLQLNDGRVAESCKNLEQAVKLSPRSSEAHFALARAYRRLGRTVDARKQMDLYSSLQQPQKTDADAPAPESEK